MTKPILQTPAAATAGGIRLDVRDSTTLKGIAILAIAAHNYFHLLSPARENEFNFDPHRVFILIGVLADPRNCVQGFFSFFGHFGVQIFIFLSAYGLATRYWDNQTPWTAFMRRRVGKILPMFLAAIGLWALSLGLPDGPAGPFQLVRNSATSLALTILGISNLVPGYGNPPIGPWWFIPFILQFYCLWPALRRFTARFEAKGLTVLSAVSILLVLTTNRFLITHWSVNLLLCPVGRLPTICLGIAAARYRPFTKPFEVGAAAVIFVASNFYGALWPLGFPCVTILMIWAYMRVRPVLLRIDLLHDVGACSMAMFLLNGFTRFPFLELAYRTRMWQWELLLGVGAMLNAYAVSELLNRGFNRGSFRVSVQNRTAATADRRHSVVEQTV